MVIDPDLKIIHSEFKMPGMRLPTNMVLIRIGDRVVLYSPLPNIADHAETIRKFGAATDIVLPSLFHDLGAREAKAVFPEARLWGVAGIAEKYPDLTWEPTLSPETWPFMQELELHVIKGMPKTREIILLHQSSKSLIVADLCFNMRSSGFLYWLFTRMFGTYNRFAVSKLFLKMVRDRHEFEESISELLTCDFEVLIPGHGEIVERSAKERLVEALSERGILKQ